MADLWKDGDVITAKKLNRIVIANVTTENVDGDEIYTLDITPDDVFDENNVPIGFIIMQNIGATTVYYTTVSAVGYEDGVYEISAIGMNFTASSRSDYFASESGGK